VELQRRRVKAGLAAGQRRDQQGYGASKQAAGATRHRVASFIIPSGTEES